MKLYATNVSPLGGIRHAGRRICRAPVCPPAFVSREGRHTAAAAVSTIDVAGGRGEQTFS